MVPVIILVQAGERSLVQLYTKYLAICILLFAYLWGKLDDSFCPKERQCLHYKM